MECPPNVVIFPFMSKGHTIPLLHLVRLLLLRRRLAITVFTTPANEPFISSSLSDVDDVSIVSLPFPLSIPGIPSGVESTDKLPSMSLFFPFSSSTKLLQPHFEEALKGLSNLKLIISDGFLHWTLQSATKFNVPRLVFFAMGYYATALFNLTVSKRLFSGPCPDDEPITVPDLPWIKLTRNDFPRPLSMREPIGQEIDHVREFEESIAASNGLLVNSFYDLEPLFIDYYNTNRAPRAWHVGPLCLVEGQACDKPSWARWMDRKLEQGIPVLYIAFGSQGEVSTEQLQEIALGLERSEVSFMWVVRPGLEQDRIVDEFAERLKERGLVVKEWVDQRGVLGHEAVQGFLSNCGWNSIIESICARKPIIAWPMMADQHLNARMVVEEIEMGIRVETCDGSVRGFVKAEGLEKTVKELMEGEAGRLARKKAKEVGEAAWKAMDEGGSSWLSLESLLGEFDIGKTTKMAIEE